MGVPDGWFLLTDTGERLWRQVNPSWVSNGRVTSQVFKPTPKDHGRLSLSRASKVGARQSHERHLARGLASVGVLSVTVGQAQDVKVTAWDDPVDEDIPEDHAHLDCTGLSRREQKAVADVLIAHARDHGWDYRIPGAPAHP
ncbi:hypothetical protein [Frankia sp. Cr2]|uniref:hypothetical protein n=1 Tax=Frankia sp. Cr2 TaxID=3073932 RepID=UPI002AD224DA|nr:hypothetical protein [Frankia sp. Cr2]